LDPCVLGRYLPGVANDVFNGIEVVVSCCLATSQRRVIRPLDTVAVHREWVAGW
jgi:hypothetical protein